uniref:Uncharacterized protein n=1 Tax=Arundo donax TaxID=35708 RepID=A0A0A9AKZ0_ARUDO
MQNFALTIFLTLHQEIM